jgi:hypothetical protein
MFATCSLAVILLLPAQTQLAPSLPVLNDKEVAEIERVIERLIAMEIGKLKGKDAAKAVADFNQLGIEAVPQLLEGLNRSADIGASCAAVVIAKKLNALLNSSEDFELLDFLRENIGAGVSAKRHTNVLKDLKLACQLRKSALQRLQLPYAKVDPDKKPLRVLTVSELATAAGNSDGARLQAILKELEARQGDAVLRVFVATLASSDSDVKQLASSLLVKHLARQSPIHLKCRLRDERPDVRMAAAKVVARRLLPLGEELIVLLSDENEDVRQTARNALVELARGADHGPERNASAADVEAAARAWRAWWEQNR